MSHGKTRRNFKCVLLNEKSQSEKAADYTIPSLGRSRKIKITADVCWDWGEGRNRQNRGSGDSEATLYDAAAVTVGTCHHTSVHPTDGTAASVLCVRVLWPQGDGVCLHRFTDWNTVRHPCEEWTEKRREGGEGDDSELY